MATINEQVNTDLVIKQTVITSGAVNTGEVDLSNYYTKYEVDRLIPKDYITEIPDEYVTDSELDDKGYLTEHLDLSDYAKKSDIPTDYYTKEEVDKKVAEGGTFDSTQYYTKNEVDAKIPTDYLKEVPSEYITESELNSKGYLTEHLDISNLATKDDLNAYQPKGNYLTEHQSLDNYYTKSEVDSKITSSGSFDATLYYTKSEVDAKIPTDYITSIPEEYVTDDELTAKGYLTQHQDLSEYAKKSDIPTDYLKEIPAEYVTESELNDKGYLTEVPDTYALKTDIPDTSNLATKDELPAEYDDTELTNRVSALETSLGNIDTLLDNINGEIV